MSDSRKTRQAGQARSALASVQPSMVEAMQALSASDPETLEAMVTMAVAMTASDHEDVCSYAVTVAPSMWLARRNDAPLHAVVAGAVGKARRAVALAQGVEIEAWDMYGDMSELAVCEARGVFDGDAATVLSHYGTAPADSQYGVTYGDVVTTAVGMVSDAGETGAAMTLERAAREYVAHERSDCCAGAGRRVTLAGVTAHVDGMTASDAAYHSSRRLMVRAVGMVSRDAVLSVTGAPGARPTCGTSRVSVGNNSPAHEAPASWAPVAPRVLPAVTVTRVQTVVTDREWIGSTDMRVSVWRDGQIQRVAVGMGSIMPSRVAGMGKHERRGGLDGVCDALGYPLRLGYGASPDVTGEWRPTAHETRTTSREVPAVTVAGRPLMFGPDVIVTERDETGAPVSGRLMSDVERAALKAPDAGRAPIVESGDSRDARPDDAPLMGRVLANGQIGSGKVPVSPRKRSGGNTGPTVPARLSR